MWAHRVIFVVLVIGLPVNGLRGDHYQCYHYTAAEIRDDPTNEKHRCEKLYGCSLTKGNNAKYPGCGTDCQCCCWCPKIDNCVDEHCTSASDVICNTCEDQGIFYTLTAGGKSCEYCPKIDHCVDQHCTSASNVICNTCEDHRIFYKLTTGDKRCERKCAWNNHYCWPGTCGDDLTRNCKCAPGFRLESRGDNETSCQLEPSNTPTIETCVTTIRSATGKQRSALRTSNSSACEFLTDMYGNFQPSRLMFNMFAEFTVDVTAATQPAFIKESNFGVTDTSVYLTRRSVTGTDVLLSTNKQLVDNSNSVNVKRTSSSIQNITLPSTNYTLTDGQRLCIKYEALGGGYLKSIDLRSSAHTVSGPVPYKKLSSTKEICYRYDSTSPKHCQESGACAMEPLHIQNRITRSGIIPLEFKGWTDPIPAGGDSSHASGIELYTITVNEVLPSKGQLKVDTGIVKSIYLNKTDTSVTLNLTFDKPKLYCITIEVKDVADNVKQGRRFVLYDNTSVISARPDIPFTVTSASKQTNLTWQTHHNDICLRWKNRFYNNFYIDNPLFNPIEPDPHGLIKGVYEQSHGVIPVSGTPNIDGIVKYVFSSSLNNGTFSREIPVPYFQNQSYCHHSDINDGETYIMTIRAVDIVNNTYTESKTVHIDRSVPHINNLWMIKDGYKRLYVHGRKDLSTMRLYFQALDPHSGIKTIEWSFGTTDAGNQLSTGMLKSGKIDDPDCSNQTSTCYCPDVGACEISNYSIPLNTLVHANKHHGNHNRNYFFTVKVTNNAMLTNIEHVDVLVDDSPPEKVVVMEACMNRTHGYNCSETCGYFSGNATCDRHTGACPYGEESASTCNDKTGTITWVVIGIGLLLFVINNAAWFLYIRRRIQNVREEKQATGVAMDDIANTGGNRARRYTNAAHLDHLGQRPETEHQNGTRHPRPESSNNPYMDLNLVLSRDEHPYGTARTGPETSESPYESLTPGLGRNEHQYSDLAPT